MNFLELENVHKEIMRLNSRELSNMLNCYISGNPLESNKEGYSLIQDYINRVCPRPTSFLNEEDAGRFELDCDDTRYRVREFAINNAASRWLAIVSKKPVIGDFDSHG